MMMMESSKELLKVISSLVIKLGFDFLLQKKNIIGNEFTSMALAEHEDYIIYCENDWTDDTCIIYEDDYK